MPKVTVNELRCKGCELCVVACPKKIMALSKDKINAKGYHCAVCVDDNACTGCTACAQMCPDTAITVER